MHDDVPELRPLSDGARKSIEGAKTVRLTRFPFRFGRESRYATVHGERVSMEKRFTEAHPNNEVYLIDEHEVLNVSREHFQIDRLIDGSYKLVDRNSTCGTIVDGRHIGSKERSSEAPLKSGSRIIVGTTDSPFVFEFVAPDEKGA